MKPKANYRSARREAVKTAARSEKVSFNELWRQLQDRVGIKVLDRPVPKSGSYYQYPHQSDQECARRVRQMEKMNAA